MFKCFVGGFCKFYTAGFTTTASFNLRFYDNHTEFFGRFLGLLRSGCHDSQRHRNPMFGKKFLGLKFH